VSTVSAAGVPVSLFYSYAHEDERLRDELDGHLKILERRGLVAPWHDRQIKPGENWHAQIDQELQMADLVLLLVSTDFINSDYIFGTELTVAMQRHAAGFATVVPIIVRAVNIEPEDADAFPFMKLQALPADLRAVTSWPNRDEAWTNVAKGLRATVKAIHEKKAASATAAPPKRGATRSLAPAPQPPRVVAPADPNDSVLTQVLDGFATQMREANQHRGGRAMDEAAMRTQAMGLIDEPDQKRVLWVDDQPEGNRYEIAALAKLQIEVVTVTSTGAALEAIERDPDGFDLVISDWSRPWDGPGAGMRLLSKIRRPGTALPLVFYHGEFGAAARAARAQQAVAAGALGEAVYPAELIALVLKGLAPAARLSSNAADQVS
jgi:CheY-like chemotaxis protein